MKNIYSDITKIVNIRTYGEKVLQFYEYYDKPRTTLFGKVLPIGYYFNKLYNFLGYIPEVGTYVAPDHVFETDSRYKLYSRDERINCNLCVKSHVKISYINKEEVLMYFDTEKNMEDYVESIIDASPNIIVKMKKEV